MGLLNLICALVAHSYVAWKEILRELERIARATPGSYTGKESESFYIHTAEELLTELSWEKVYDFCERLYSHLAREVGFMNEFHEFEVTTPKSEVQEFIGLELQRLFLEEGLAFDFSEGVVQRRGKKHTSEKISQAEVVMGDSRLLAARKHYKKALQFFRAPSDPDFENTVKEAVCAVEAAGKALFPEAKAATLDDLAKWLVTNGGIRLPKALSQTLTGLYGFRSGGTAVAHGGASGGTVTLELAEYVLAVAASQIILLFDLANANEEILPF